MVIWICGISAAGKTAISSALLNLLKPKVPEVVLIDGDQIRAAFGFDLKFSEEDRSTQIKRIQNIAKLLSDQNLVVVVAALYSHPDLLLWNRENFNGYFEVYVDISLETARARDPKGLYAGASTGQITDMVGIDIPWHVPNSPDLIIDNNGTERPENLALKIIEQIPRLSNAVKLL